MTTAERRGVRPALLAAGLFVLVVCVVPIGALVRGNWAPLIRLDNRVERGAHDDAIEHGLVRGVAKVLTQLGAPVLVELATALLVAWLFVRRSQNHLTRHAAHIAYLRDDSAE